ncbi:MAG: SBBP repeat-containing protein, partial [Anaerolineales bacterium]|nr:SBBP repeat-containing protein [Anaerolineales bacterium]
MFYPSHLTHTSTAKKGSGLLLPLALLALALLLLNGRFATPDNAPRATIQNIGGFPLAFVSEEGQTDVLFTAYSRPGTLAFMHDSVQIALPTTSLAVTFVGQQGATAVSGTGLLPGKVHEYRGSANDRWQNSLATYNAITYNGLYPGIDLTYDGSEGLLKGTYTVAPGADPALIRWQYAGATAVNRDPDSGDLHITVAPDVTLIEKAPIAYQMVNGRQQPIPIQYDLHGDEIGFIVGAYDGERPLIIDPTLIYSSFLGSNSDDGAKDVAIDASGNIYVTGSTYSTSFPGSGGGNAGYTDLFVTKINAAGTAILYTTLLGGNGTDEPGGIAVNDNGSQIWIVGSTTSSNFPTQNPFQPDNGGGVDAFILQLGSNGTLAFSSYYGGFLYDAAEDVALDSHDDVHITGSLWGGFFAKVDGQAYELVYSNMIGGQEAIGYGIALDSTDNIYVTGEIRSDSWPTVNAVQNACGPYDDWTCSTDAFVVKITPAGDDLLFSTYLGGSAANGGSGTDIGRAIAV